MGRAISRRRAYAIIAVGCVAAGAIAATFDQITVTISPEYFIEGKNLDPSGMPIRALVAWMGFRAGLPLGALVAGMGLLRAQRVLAFSWREWLEAIAATAAVAVVVGGALMAAIDPFSARAASAGRWSGLVATRYLVGWGLHVGAYFGVGLGLLRATYQRRTPGDRRPDHSG